MAGRGLLVLPQAEGGGERQGRPEAWFLGGVEVGGRGLAELLSPPGLRPCLAWQAGPGASPRCGYKLPSLPWLTALIHCFVLPCMSIIGIHRSVSF